jgi:bifunctional non-homologous end joining protein LigD
VDKRTVASAGKRQVLSNLGKNFYPTYGFTKADVLDYYRLVAPAILPHLRDRALTMRRYPNGTGQDFFFEKRCPAHRPAWVKTAVVHHGETMTVCLVNDLETLTWVENLASIELHVPMARAQSAATPDYLVFDLDPGEQVDVLDCARVALILRDLLETMGLSSLPKTSGKKGLHVYVPLNRSETTFDATKRFAKAVAEVLQRNYPDLVTAKMALEHRKDKVFINWSQNDPKKTMVCVYSLRALSRPTASFPLEWKALRKLADLGNPEKLSILHSEALSRLRQKGDLFHEVLTKQQRLPSL